MTWNETIFCLNSDEFDFDYNITYHWNDKLNFISDEMATYFSKVMIHNSNRWKLLTRAPDDDDDGDSMDWSDKDSLESLFDSEDDSSIDDDGDWSDINSFSLESIFDSEDDSSIDDDSEDYLTVKRRDE